MVPRTIGHPVRIIGAANAQKFVESLAAGQRYDLQIGDASHEGKLILSGQVNPDLVNGGTYTNLDAHVAHPNLAGVDALGGYFLQYGTVTDYDAEQVSYGLSAATSLNLQFGATKSGALGGMEIAGNIAGASASTRLQGQLYGAYVHCDFAGTGNSAVIDEVVGIDIGIGLSSSGSGYTVTDAIGLRVGAPSATNIGTLTRSYSIFSESTVGVGGTTAAPNFKITSAGSVTLDDAATITFGDTTGSISMGRNSTDTLDVIGGAVQFKNTAATRYRTSIVTASGGQSTINAYDDTGGAYIPLSLQALSVSLKEPGGAVKIQTNATGIGFYAATPAEKPTVSGAKGSNAALGSLLSALSTLGLVTDSTTA